MSELRGGAAANTAAGASAEWIVYQIGDEAKRNSARPYRFVISEGFDDEAVTAQLQPGEFIDTTTTVYGEFGGDVTILRRPDPVRAELLEAVKGTVVLLNLLRTGTHRRRGAVTYEYVPGRDGSMVKVGATVKEFEDLIAKATGGQP